MLSRGNILESELTVPGRETIFTRARMKEHSILDNLAISDLQIITESSRSGPKFKPMISALEDHEKSDLDPDHDHLPTCDLRSRSDHDLTRKCDLQIMI